MDVNELFLHQQKGHISQKKHVKQYWDKSVQTVLFHLNKMQTLAG